MKELASSTKADDVKFITLSISHVVQLQIFLEETKVLKLSKISGYLKFENQKGALVVVRKPSASARRMCAEVLNIFNFNTRSYFYTITECGLLVVSKSFFKLAECSLYIITEKSKKFFFLFKIFLFKKFFIFKIFLLLKKNLFYSSSFHQSLHFLSRYIHCRKTPIVSLSSIHSCFCNCFSSLQSLFVSKIT